MFSNRQLTLSDYWLIVWRRKWLLLLPFVAVGSGTVLWCFSLPNIYRASTTILVEAQKVPDGYVRSTVSSPVQERLRTITQQIKSHTRLEQVMRELRLREDVQDKEAVERYINKMRRNIELEVKTGDAFTVSYADQDPHTAMMVTNQLASLFITENLKVREQHVVGTTEFLAQELERVRTLLENQEKAVSEYTQRYAEELAGGVNRQAQERLQGQLQTNADAMEQLRFQKSSLMQRLAVLEQESIRNDALDSVFDSGISSTPSGPAGIMQDPLERQIAQRREALIELQSRFSDQYPDVRRLKQEIADLEAQLAAKPAPQPAEPVTTPRRPSPEVVLAEVRRQGVQEERRRLQRDINEQLRQLDFQEQRLQRNRERIQQQSAAYEHKLANAALRQQELQVHSRDYESTKQNYASLLAGHMQAKVAENLEKRQKAEQFKVLDPALLPVQPWKPDRRKILMMGLVLGLGVGCGAVVLAEYLDRSFHDPEDLRQSIDLPVLAIIPLFPAAGEQSMSPRTSRLLPVDFVERRRV